MKEKHKKKNLAEKVKEKIEQLRLVHEENGGVTVGVEVQKNLEKTLESHLLANARLESAKKEHDVAKANEAVAAAELRSAHKHIKKLLKKQTDAKKTARKNQKK